MKKAVIIGALDSKGVEFEYVKMKLEASGIPTFVVNTGILGEPRFAPDIDSDTVAAHAGTSLQQLRETRDRGEAVAAMTRGVAALLPELVEQGIVGAVFGMGGTAGTTIGAAAMQAVPIGIPKLLVSTVASGDTRPYVGVKDIAMMYSVIDIAGLNTLSRRILANAAHALAGMLQHYDAVEDAAAEDKTVLGMTMFGVTTPCCDQVRIRLEAEGFDLLVFHATGAGGTAMEELVRAGFIKGVLDITTTELADELVGGIFSAGPNRLKAAGAANIPQVVSVGALDMVNFGPPDTVPATFRDRKFYQHNPTTTLMRTTSEENAELGRRLAGRLNAGNAPTILVFPEGGVSLLDVQGKAFHGEEQRQALLQGIVDTLRPDIPLIRVREDINHPDTAKQIAESFLHLYRANP
ncbi:Tm-1-like ATP-binding domain-containing protein [Paenibacillus koleovorans]|uniref:Tm-1-like ATP-binding domain-containing protein n=1 Tax=Paenibacillus koleovorans TaxID=121608 RepID=UPI000FD7850E|nr:Tm-1-like ATP-binding domain-containing protein [Paenibacillus koleovorans]